MQQRFHAPSWAAATNIYEVNLRQYTPEGSIEAFRKHLPRLQDMGVDLLWFMPITPISVKGRKGSLGSYYACSSYHRVNPEYGTMADFQELVRDAQERGMKVMIDWVANHTGCDHEWTVAHPDFYLRNAEGQFFDENGWDDVIDLNYANRELRMAMIDAMKYWIREAGIDGFRCDMAMLTPADFWLEARTAIEQEKHLFWLAELDPLDNPEYMEVFDSAYTWTWMHDTRSFIQHPEQRSVERLRKTLIRYRYELPDGDLPAWFTSNHDENSWNGTEYEKYGVMAESLAVFSSTWPGLPLLYSGQELPNHRRLAFFDKDLIQWSGQPALHDFYKTLFSLRKNHPALDSGIDAQSAQTVWDRCTELSSNASRHMLAYHRHKDNQHLVVFINWSDDALDLSYHGLAHTGSYREIFAGKRVNLLAEGRVQLNPWAYLVFVSE